MEKYDMREYWEMRAKKGADIYEMVCAYGAPHQFNEIMDKIQNSCLSTLLNQISDISGKKVLEIGCGVGRWAYFMVEKKKARYIGVDISPRMIEIATREVPKGNFYVIDGEKLDFPDNYFDLVFSVTVLHHIPYDKKEKMISEICRVTKKGGYIIILEDISFKKPKQTFNMFPLLPNEWIASFNKHKCKCIKIVKHKFLQSHLLLLTRKFPHITNTQIFKFLWTEIVEKVATKILPWKFFAGCGIIFQKQIKK